MLIPLSDDDRSLSRPARVTFLLIGMNIAVFFFLQGCGTNAAFTYGYSVIPAEITNGVDLVASQSVRAEGGRVEIPQAPGPTPIYATILFAMFMHGGYIHLFSNLLYLWIFGDNIEHRFGAFAFMGLYLAAGVAGTFAQIFLAPESVVPNLGASGAISGVLGAYLVLFPRNRVHALFFIFVVSVPAVVIIGLWIVFQLIEGLGTLGAVGGQVGGVAYGAHIGGFFAGLILAMTLRLVIKGEKPNVLSRAAVNDGSRRIW